MITADFLVIGGGIIGLTAARELKKTYPGSKVVLIEKEPDCGLHASGRNSGVLHAGFYYTKDTMKAKFTREGNRALTEYCESRRIPVNRCGKLVVARNQSELASLRELLERGKTNGIELHEIPEAEARKIEPRVKTFGSALFSPTTSTVNPVQVMREMKNDAIREGIKVHTGVRYTGRNGKSVKTSAGDYQAAYHVNAAGLYADKIARDFGFSENYCLLPFKGIYLYSDEPPGSVRTNVYPVPDLGNPFLGVHFTVTSERKIKIGPTAIPAFWREQYGMLDNFSLTELMEIVAREFTLFLSSKFDFRRLALEEMKKYSRNYMVSLASSLLSGVNRDVFNRWARPGIRAQLVNTKEKRLEMDFVLEGDEGSMHVLNAVSPAFTCSMPFARHICAEIKKRINQERQ